MTGQPASFARPLTGVIAVVTLGLLVGLTTLIMLTEVRATLLYVGLAAFCLAIPTLIVRNPRAYWLFLLVASIPIDIKKHTTTWLADPQTLYNQFGPPPSGLSLDVWVTDAILLMMLLTWVVRLCLRLEKFYFPKIAYLYLVYLAWALSVSILEATSFYFSLFQWTREILYFVFFIYLCNSVVTRTEFRAVLLGLFVAGVISAGTVLSFFALGIGTETSAFSGLYSYVASSSATKSLTLYQTSSSLSIRSSGIFPHPALAACFFGLTLPIALSYFLAARRWFERIVFATLFVFGFAATYVTYSRAGLVGLVVGCIVSFPIARFSRLVSNTVFSLSVVAFLMAALASLPLLITSIQSRPESVSGRWDLLEIALDTYAQRPFVGQGLNNSSALINERAKVVDRSGKTQFRGGIPTHYLVVLVEVGAIGFAMYFAFFGRIVMTAFLSMRTNDTEMKALLVGMVAGLVSLATQNLADNALGGHSTNALLWFYTSMIIAIARKVRVERTKPALPPPEMFTLRLPVAVRLY